MGAQPGGGAIGVLVVLFQGMSGGGGRATVVGIEEPEIALLIDSVTEASQAARVIVSGHRADLLDHDAIPNTSILASLAEHGGP